MFRQRLSLGHIFPCVSPLFSGGLCGTFWAQTPLSGSARKNVWPWFFRGCWDSDSDRKATVVEYRKKEIYVIKYQYILAMQAGRHFSLNVPCAFLLIKVPVLEAGVGQGVAGFLQLRYGHSILGGS